MTSLLAVIVVLGLVSPVVSSVSFDNVPENRKALDNFKKRFSAVQNEQWYHLKNRSIVVFESEGVKFTVEYNKKGDVTGIEKLYREGSLDREIRRIVKSVYFDYKITNIREITLPELFSKPVYIIQVEDETSFKNLSVYDSEMRVVEEFEKTDEIKQDHFTR